MIKLNKSSALLLDTLRLTKQERIILDEDYNSIIKAFKECKLNNITIQGKIAKYLNDNLSKSIKKDFIIEVLEYIGFESREDSPSCCPIRLFSRTLKGFN